MQRVLTFYWESINFPMTEYNTQSRLQWDRRGVYAGGLGGRCHSTLLHELCATQSLTEEKETMNETLQWINQMERWAFPTAFDEPPVSKTVVYDFISNSTVMNELMHNVSNDYVRDFVDSMYTSPRINKHGLKRFIILDYPLSVIESIFREEHKPKIRSIKAGLYPFNGGHTINACSRPAPNGEGVIFFSEWLFAFLWDYFHTMSSAFPPGTKPGDGTMTDENRARQIKDDFIRKLSTGAYKNWDVNTVLASKPVTNSARYDLLFALIFIWAHEIGHILLSHLNSAPLKQEVFLSTTGNQRLLPVYNIDQQLEYDADMFASDVYFHYLKEGITFPDENFKRSLISRGMEFFILLARTEKDPFDEQWMDADHPPTPSRLLNVCLRHRTILTEYGWGDLFEKLEKAVGKDKPLSRYNYRKDLGTQLLLN